ncbi:MAG TPA: hypothetical protein VNP96_06820 [Solirubrobacterales bacterium]|nr:hypothetical protein [Solirubrobacterales bacterium]
MESTSTDRPSVLGATGENTSVASRQVATLATRKPKAGGTA